MSLCTGSGAPAASLGRCAAAAAVLLRVHQLPLARGTGGGATVGGGATAGDGLRGQAAPPLPLHQVVCGERHRHVT